MSWRKWLVRSLVFSIFGALVVSVGLYQCLTAPSIVRRQVLVRLEEYFPGAEVSLSGGRLGVLGNISVNELRMVRRDDASKYELLHAPTAYFFHDKEQLVNGKVIIRRIELLRPHLHIIRRADGRWNVEKLLSPPNLARTVPTIVIKQGTIIVEDQFGTPPMPTVELNGVDLTLLNDPLPTVEIRCSASCPLTGRVRLSATWQRSTDEVTLSVEAKEAPLGSALIAFVKAVKPEIGGGIEDLAGKADVKVNAVRRVGSAVAWRHDLEIGVAGGRLRHQLLPLPLEQIEFRARCVDGVVSVDQFSAHSSRAELTGTLKTRGALTSYRSGTPLEEVLQSLDLRIKNLTVTAALFDKLPGSLKKIRDGFTPSGPIDLALTVEHAGPRWRKHAFVTLRDLSMTYEKFRYPISHVKGTVETELSNLPPTDHVTIDLTGSPATSSAPLAIKGAINGEGRYAAVELDVTGQDVLLDDTVLAALPAGPRKIANSFHPSGRGNFVARIRRRGGGYDFENTYTIRFHNAKARYDVFPYPLEDMSGELEILPDHSWEFRDFVGYHKGCMVHTRGKGTPTPSGDRLEVAISGRHLLLDSELQGALQPELQAVWKTFSPGGRIDFAARVERAAAAAPEIDVQVKLRDVNARPDFFPYDLSAMSGSIRYVKHWVFLEDVHARHGKVELNLGQGMAFCKPGGGFWARLGDVVVNPLIPDEPFLTALPPIIRQSCRVLQLRDPITLRTVLVIDSNPGLPPVIYWDGSIRAERIHLFPGVPVEGISGVAGCRGLYDGKRIDRVVGNMALEGAGVFGQPLRNLHARFEVPPHSSDEEKLPVEARNQTTRPDVLIFDEFRAEWFGGELYGPVRVEFGEPLNYEMSLTASRIQLEEFGRHNLGADSQIGGLATGRLYLHGTGNELAGLEGSGTVEVPNGRLYNLPILLDLLKWIGLRPADHTAFEEARAAFDIRGPRVEIKRLDLFGNAISLGGQGGMNLDGSDIRLDFYAVWGRTVQMLPQILSQIPPAISRELLRIKMRGDIKKVTFQNEPVPLIVEPLRELFDRVRDRRK